MALGSSVGCPAWIDECRCPHAASWRALASAPFRLLLVGAPLGEESPVAPASGYCLGLGLRVPQPLEGLRAFEKGS